MVLRTERLTRSELSFSKTRDPVGTCQKKGSCRLQVDFKDLSSKILSTKIYGLQTSHLCFRHGDKADEYKEKFQELQDAYERICRHVVTRTSSHTWAVEFRFGGGPCIHESRIFLHG